MRSVAAVPARGLAVASSIVTMLAASVAPGPALAAPAGQTAAIQLHASELALWNSHRRRALTAMGEIALAQRLGLWHPARVASVPAAGGPAPTAAGAATSSNVPVSNPGEDHSIPCNTQSETTVVAVDALHLVAAFNDSSAGCSVLTSYTGWAHSSDGGHSWVDAGSIQPASGGFVAGDPALATDRQGRVFLADMENAPGARPVYPAFLGGRGLIAVHVSRDMGTTFGPAVDATAGAAGTWDKPMIAVDNTGGPHDGTVYVAYTDLSGGGGRGRIMFSRSTDHGASFAPPIALSDAQAYNQGAVPAVGPDGQVYVTWGTQLSPIVRIWFTVSRDGGATFADPRLIRAYRPPGQYSAKCGREAMNNDIRMLSWPVMAVDTTPLTAPPSGRRYRGTIYIAFAAARNLDEGDIYLIRSTDGGRTWSGGRAAPKSDGTPYWDPPGVRLNDDSGHHDQFMASITSRSGGAAAVTWFDRRADPADIRFEVWGATTTDGGLTWSRNQRISDGSSIGVGNNATGQTVDDPGVATCYMGDYNQVVPLTSGYGLAWGDNRDPYLAATPLARPDPNVYWSAFR